MADKSISGNFVIGRSLTRFSLFVMLLAATMLGACGGGGSSPEFSLMFEAPGGTGLADGQVNGIAYRPDVTQDFTFAMGVAVSGQVTDGAGAPINTARVSFRQAGNTRDIDNDRTNGSGDYTVTLFAGTWTATIDSGRDELGTISVGGLTVLAGVSAIFDFQFPALEVLSGTVSSSLGSGIDSARITFTGRDSGAKVSVTCDGNGAYTANLCPDTYDAVVTPVGDDADTQLKQRFTVVVAAPGTRNFMLTAGVQVSGTIFNSVGLTVREDTDVRVILPGGSDFFAPDSVEADGDFGTYTIGPVPLGRVVFELEAPGRTGLPVQRFTRTVLGPIAQTEDFTLASGFVLRGTILRDDGVTPASNVEVEAIPTKSAIMPDDVDTDDFGVYEIALFAGTYDVHITPDGDNQQLPEIRRITITAPTVVDITLNRGVILSGIVRLPGGVIPAEDIRVEIPGALDARDTTDGAGRYSMLVPVGTHTLVLTARDGALEDMALAPVTGVVVVAPGPVVRDIVLALATTGSTVVHGVVVASDGVSPILGAEVVARDEDGETIGRAITDVTGQYILVIP